MTPDGVTLTARDPIVKAAMLALSEIWPQTVLFESLLAEARSRLGPGGSVANDTQILGQSFLNFYVSASNSLLELHVHPPRFCATVSDRPEAFALARHQARLGTRVTNLRHESLYLGEFERHILQNLDGARDRDGLVEVIAAVVDRGDLTVEKDGQPVVEPAGVRAAIRKALEQQLPIIAKRALLVR